MTFNTTRKLIGVVFLILAIFYWGKHQRNVGIRDGINYQLGRDFTSLMDFCEGKGGEHMLVGTTTLSQYSYVIKCKQGL